MSQIPNYSLPGRPFQDIAIGVYVLIVGGLLVASLLEALGLLQSGMGYGFYLVFAALSAPIGLLVIFITPNSVDIRLAEDGISIYTRRKQDFVQYHDIINVSHIKSMHGISSYGYDVYRIDFKAKTNFGKKIYFRCNGSILGPPEGDPGKTLLYRARLAAKKKRMQAGTKT